MRIASLKKAALAGLSALALSAGTAFAATAPVPDKGDTAWMLVSTVLVLLMIVPGLALFYGGLVRTKNMLSVLMQCTLIGAMVMVIWVVYGWSFGRQMTNFWGMPVTGIRRSVTMMLMNV